MGAGLVKCASTPNNTAGQLQVDPVRQTGGSGKGYSTKDRICCDLCCALGTGYCCAFCYCNPANPFFNKALLDKRVKLA